MTPYTLGPPVPEAVFDDDTSAGAALKSHARANGYAVYRIDWKRRGGYHTEYYRAVWACDKAGGYDSRGRKSNVDESKRRNNTKSKKTGCDFRVEVRKDKISEKWVVKTLVGTHNHPASASPAEHPQYRIGDLKQEEHDLIIKLADSGVTNRDILALLRRRTDWSCSLLQTKDITNIVQKEKLQRRKPADPEWD